MIAELCNSIYLSFAGREHRAFFDSASLVKETQTEILARIVQANADTVFGREHSLAAAASLQPEALPAEFRARVPLRTAAEFEPWLARSVHEERILTAEPILYFEETTGSTGRPRPVPYTASFRASLTSAVSVWMKALSLERPQAFQGRAWWAASPPLRPSTEGLRTASDDSQYLSPLEAFLMRRVLARTGGSRFRTPAEFYFHTLFDLLRTRDLAFISVWSPLFFMRLDEELRRRWPELRKARRDLPAELETWKALWPRLAVVSCWTDAWARPWKQKVEERSGVPVQGKGLMATEGVTTIPADPGTPLLAYRSHFFEFAAGDRILLAHELEPGQVYEVILTTAAGLMRFRTGDLVECAGFLGRVPRLAFLGRANTWDMTGEKITESAADRALAVLARPGLRAVFAADETELRYLLLFMDESGTVDAEQLAGEAEQIFLENPYYAQARAAGELARLQAHRLTAEAWDRLPVRGREGTRKARSILDRGTDASVYI